MEEQKQNGERPEAEAEANKIVPLPPRGARMREKLLRKTAFVPWEELPASVSLDNFPYYIEEKSKSLLVECVASHFKQSKLRKYGARLRSSSRRILLQTIPGVELYRERLVSALAREMQVPLMKFDDDEEEDEDDSDDSADESDEKVDDKAPTLKKGYRVKYVGNTISIEEVKHRTLSKGQRGEVLEVNGERVAVAFNICGLKIDEGVKDEENSEIVGQALLIWLHVKDVKKEVDAKTHDCYIGIELLYEVLKSRQTALVYFPSSSPFSCHGSPMLIRKLERMFNQLPEGLVMISLKDYIERVHRSRADGNEMQRLFPNVISRRFDCRFCSGKRIVRNKAIMRISPKDEAAKVEEKEQNEERSSESESESNKIVPFSPRAARLREKVLSEIVIVPWEEVIYREDKKTLLVECVASHLKQSKLRKYGARLKSSSRRILLQTIPGTELYRERLVSALAREMQVPLLKFDDEEEEDEDDSDDDDD